MRKILAILLVLVLITTMTTALAESDSKKVVTGSLEIEIKSDNETLLELNISNEAAITFDVSNLKPGDRETIDWTVKNIGTLKGIIDYLRVKATQNGGITNAPEAVNDPDNSGDLGSLLICILTYGDKDYILPMDEVLSPEGMLYNPSLILNPNESAQFFLTIYWPNHYDDNIGQGDEMKTTIDIHMTEIEDEAIATPTP
jgi:hypothetical protein